MKKVVPNSVYCFHRKLGLAIAVAAACVSSAVIADEKKPDNEISFNAAVTTDYRYRGVSQSRLGPALQGGADYTHNPSGWYAGVWASTIKWTKDAGGNGHSEWDWYGGKRGEFLHGLTYDIGGLGYVYPSNGLRPNANTFEFYGQVGFGPAYLKYSESATNLFGFADSKNSAYVDFGANIEVQGGCILNLHVGHQSVRNNSAFSYTDFKIGVSKDFGIANLSLAVYRADTAMYVGRGDNLAKTGLVLSLSKTF